jgi:hypothetical protein
VLILNYFISTSLGVEPALCRGLFFINQLVICWWGAIGVPSGDIKVRKLQK